MTKTNGTIRTKFGTFDVTDNNNGGTIISLAGTKIAEFGKVSWWNVDSLENAIEQNIEIINERIKQRNSGKSVKIS